jgi:hypothetical protein
MGKHMHMQRQLRAIAAILTLGTATAACGPRQVEVQTAPTQSAEVAIHFSNNLSQAVNLYVNTGTSDLFVRQVAAKTVEHVPVPGVSVGARATLKAKPVNGAAGYERAGVTMTEMVSWTVP